MSLNCLYQTCKKCQKCCLKSAYRGETSKLLANLAGSGCRSKSGSNPERGLHPPVSNPTKLGKISNSHKLLCQSPQEPLPAGGITSAYRQKHSRACRQPEIAWVFNRLFLFPKPNKWRPILDLSKLNLFLKVEKFKMETPETIRTSLQQGEWVTSIDFRNALTSIYQYRNSPGNICSRKYLCTVVAKEVKLIAIHKGIRIHQYLDDWLVRGRSHQVCLPHTQDLVKMCQQLGWLVNLEKSELEPKQVFDFVGYQFDLKSSRVRPTPARWQHLQEKIQTLLALPACLVRQFMSLVGLLTVTEKQVHLGRLHMRPIQWHLKNNWTYQNHLKRSFQYPGPCTHIYNGD